MARRQRIHYEGALYHVIARGNNGDYILKESEDKKKYIELIERYEQRYGFQLYAYCLMDNHVHLLIEVSKVPLNKIMQGIQLVYTQVYNRKYKRTGHIFQQRYKAVVCNKDVYLLQLTKYIHNNPVKARITEDVNYEWSSYNYYKKGQEGLVNTSFVLKMLSQNKNKAIEEYKKYMKEEDGDIEESEYEVTEAQRYTADKTKKIKLIELVEQVIRQENVTLEQLTEKTRKQDISDIRKAIVLLSKKHCDTTSTELAKRLNIPISMVSKIKAGEAKETGYLREVLSRFE